MHQINQAVASDEGMRPYVKKLFQAFSGRQLDEAIRLSAVQRVRPKAMTVAVILAGLLPIILGSGTGSEVVPRIAAPMIGGMITAPLISMFVIPVVYLLLRERTLVERSHAP